MNYGKKLFTILAIVAVAVAAFFAIRHFTGNDVEIDKPNPIEVTTPTATTTTTTTTEPTSTEPTLDALKAQVLADVDTVKPNEAGEVMILVYHKLGTEDLEYDRSVESFKRDLDTLYNMGFRSVSMEDYLNSTFDVPAGTTPVVITFDDGDISHFRAVKDSKGKLVPASDCAVGILNDFYEKHPDFGRNAIFFLNAYPFGEPDLVDWKIKYLLDNGYEIGNHSFGHEFLNKLTAAEIQEALGRNNKYYLGIDERVKMNVLALPYGIPPEEGLEEYSARGEFDGVPYEHVVQLLVGWRPTWPLYIEGIDPTGINRVQCGTMEHQLQWWLDFYAEEPANRFISDGVPEIITVPEEDLRWIDQSTIDPERLLSY